MNTRRTLGDLFITPHYSITEMEDRNRAYATAGLSIVLLIATAVMTIQALIRTGTFSPSAGANLILFAITYGLARSRWAKAGSYLLVFGSTVLYFGLIAIYGSPETTAQGVPYLLLPILASILIAEAWVTILASVLIAGTLLVFTQTVTWLDFQDISMAFITTSVVSVLAVATALIRERDLLTIQKQTKNLGKYSEELEAEVEQRTRRIMATAEVGRAITGARDLDSLLKQVVNLIVEQFDFYHAQVFLIDATNRFAELRESTGVAGAELLARRHRLEIGSQSVIGQVTSQGTTVIASDTDADAVHRRNELLPHTRSEMALPLRVGGRIIGALDIQSVNPNAFDETDIPVFQTMADQLAIAIENARLFEQAQRDLQDIELLNRQLTGKAWREYVGRRSEPAGYQVSAAGVKPLPAGDTEPEKDEGAVSLPLRVRGETIGVLDVTSRSGESPDEDTQKMLEEVAERVAMALDSTRLGEQSRRQAEREQILGRISAELQASADLDTILRIVVKETSQALGAPTGFVHLTTKYGGDQLPSEVDSQQ